MSTSDVAAVSDVLPGSGTIVEVGEIRIALFHIEGAFYAISNTCAHMDGALGEGTLEGHIVVCPLHSWEYDVRNGTCVAPVWCKDKKNVRAYPVTVQAGRLLIDVD